MRWQRPTCLAGRHATLVGQCCARPSRKRKKIYEDTALESFIQRSVPGRTSLIRIAVFPWTDSPTLRRSTIE